MKKLTSSQYEYILRNPKIKAKEIAKSFGCSPNTVYSLRWKKKVTLKDRVWKPAKLLKLQFEGLYRTHTINKIIFELGITLWQYRRLKIICGLNRKNVAKPKTENPNRNLSPAERRVAIGTISFHKIKKEKMIKTESGWVMLKRFLWENANGKIGKNDIIVFQDGNKDNCVLENLQKISRADLGKNWSASTTEKRNKAIRKHHSLRGLVTWKKSANVLKNL